MIYKRKTQSPKRKIKTQSLKFLVLNFGFALCALHFVLCNVVYAQPLSSTELINNNKFYDGKTVVYEGEVIGDIMVRGEYAWININDGRNAIGIWIDKRLTKDILYVGNYKYRGDWVEISGVFHRACLQHGGDLDIHAQGIRKISGGRLILERLNISKRNQALVLLGVLFLVWILKYARPR